MCHHTRTCRLPMSLSPSYVRSPKLPFSNAARQAAATDSRRARVIRRGFPAFWRLSRDTRAVSAGSRSSSFTPFSGRQKLKVIMSCRKSASIVHSRRRSVPHSRNSIRNIRGVSAKNSSVVSPRRTRAIARYCAQLGADSTCWAPEGFLPPHRASKQPHKPWRPPSQPPGCSQDSEAPSLHRNRSQDETCELRPRTGSAC